MLLDYLKKIGQKSFQEKPCNDLDLLIFSTLIYLDLSEDNFSHNKKLFEVLDDINSRKKKIYETLFPFRKKDIKRFLSYLKSRRYENVEVIRYCCKYSLEYEEQFCAATFLIPGQSYITVYRGTDSSFIGWKEDCKLALSKPVPAQRSAAQFLEKAINDTRKSPKNSELPMQVCGHSKGGNLAIYAASFISSELRPYISDIISFDGPGINKAIMERGGYKALQNRMRTYIPHASIVGLLFQQPPDVRTIEAWGPIPLQHSPFTWIISEESLQFSEHTSYVTRILSEGIQGLIEQLNEKQKIQFIEVLYRIALSTKSTGIREMFDTLSFETISNIVKAVNHEDKETALLIIHVLKIYWENALKALSKPQRYKNQNVAIMGPQPKLILASASPRRRELLHNAGFSFEVLPSKIEEKQKANVTPFAIAKDLARQKAFAVFNELHEENAQDNSVVLGADTIVVLDKTIYGKPTSPQDAARILHELSGKTHRVITGVCLVSEKKSLNFAEVTHITFKDLSNKEIDAYVRSGEPLDKAGAYGIQGDAANFISGIVGDYANVVGLPINRVQAKLTEFGISPALSSDLI